MRSSKFLNAAALLGAALSLSSFANAAETAAGMPSAGQAIGLSGTELPLLDNVAVGSRHVYDYTFASAPTDWRVQSGIWEMTNRWACSPGWSWFGGRSDETAAVWNKRKFSGDVSVQMYFAFKMGLSGVERWWEVPSDAGLTIGGDGQNLASGYSLIIGADGNTHTVLRKGGEVVADTNAPFALLPTLTDGIPKDNDNVLHRRWWYVRMDKIGSKVSCYLDNKLLFTYDDPRPLDAGQVALWTYNNGIVLSRVQIYYQDEDQPQLRRFAAASPQAPTSAKATIKTVKAAPARRAAGIKIAQRF